MAKKQTRKGKVTQLPKGFTAIGGFGRTFPDDDNRPGDAIRGVVTGYQEDIKTQHGKTSLLRLETKEGEVYTVWQSAALGVLFDEDYTDVEIFLRFDGMGKKKGKKNPPKLFTLAIAD